VGGIRASQFPSSHILTPPPPQSTTWPNSSPAFQAGTLQSPYGAFSPCPPQGPTHSCSGGGRQPPGWVPMARWQMVPTSNTVELGYERLFQEHAEKGRTGPRHSPSPLRPLEHGKGRLQACPGAQEQGRRPGA
jgi:hypothetical protein